VAPSSVVVVEVVVVEVVMVEVVEVVLEFKLRGFLFHLNHASNPPTFGGTGTLPLEAHFYPLPPAFFFFFKALLSPC
jgi:hypothetical protein